MEMIRVLDPGELMNSILKTIMKPFTIWQLCFSLAQSVERDEYAHLTTYLQTDRSEETLKMFSCSQEKSLIELYDDITRLQNILMDGCEQDGKILTYVGAFRNAMNNCKIITEFVRFAVNHEKCRMNWLASIGECSKLKKELDDSRKEVSSLESKLLCARKLLDLERKHVRALNMEKLELERKFAVLMGSSVSQRENNFDVDTSMIPKLKWERNSRSSVDGRRMRTSGSLEMSDSWMLDFSYSQSDDDLSGETWKKMRPSLECPTVKGRRSFGSSDKSHKIEMPSVDNLIQVTTGNGLLESNINKACATDQGIKKEEQMMCNPQNSQVPVIYRSASLLNVSDGSDCPKSKDQSVDGLLSPDIGLDFEVMKRINSRQHCFVQKIVVKPEECNPCGKRIHFCNMLIKCIDCKVLSHPECKENISLPCISSCSSPKVKNGSIADYVPVVSPMVPSLVIHCVKEVESRGLSEVGIYQIPGSDKKIKNLKKKFLQGKGAPNLADHDINVVCGVLKDFLCSLGEPLITNSLWSDFARAAQVSDTRDSTAALYQAISELPKPNQDTLAYLILHLKKVASCHDCKITMENLSKVFGPCVSGNSGINMSAKFMNEETNVQQQIIKSLMRIQSEYWLSFINKENTPRITQSPGPFTPLSANSKTPSTVKEKKKFLQRKL